MTSSPHDYADPTDLVDQQTPFDEMEAPDVRGHDEVDEADLLEQAASVPEDDDDHRE